MYVHAHKGATVFDWMLCEWMLVVGTCEQQAHNCLRMAVMVLPGTNQGMVWWPSIGTSPAYGECISWHSMRALHQGP